MKAKFDMKRLYEGGTNVFINNPGHITKMATMPIYGEKLQKSFPEPLVLFVLISECFYYSYVLDQRRGKGITETDTTTTYRKTFGVTCRRANG